MESRRITKKQKTRNYKPLLIILLFLTAGLIAGHFALPLVAEWALQTGWIDSLEVYGVTDVRLEVSSGLKLLWGRYDQLEVSGSNLIIGTLRISNYTLKSLDGGVKIGSIISSREVILDNQHQADLSLTLTREDFAQWLQQYYGSLHNLLLFVEDNYLTITGVADVLDYEVPVILSSELTVSEQETILLTVRRLYTEKVISEEAMALLENMFDLEIDLRPTRPSTFVKSVRVTEQGIFIEAVTPLKDKLFR